MMLLLTAWFGVWTFFKVKDVLDTRRGWDVISKYTDENPCVKKHLLEQFKIGIELGKKEEEEKKKRR